MEREHKIYFIISGLAYLIFCLAFKFSMVNSIPYPIYKVFNYFQLLTLVLVFIYGIRNSIRAIVIWLGFLCVDFISHLNNAILSIYSLNFINFFYFALIAVAVVYGVRSLNVNTVATENFSKMYRKTAIVFFICNILFYILASTSVIESLWVIRSKLSIVKLQLYFFSIFLSLVITIGVTFFVILKIEKREAFGFVFAAVILVWRFVYFASKLIIDRSFNFAYDALQNDVISSNPILSFSPRVLHTFGPHILVFLLLLSLVPLANFLFYLKRDPELFEAKGDAV